MRKGDIFWAKLDPVVGSETAKTRPVLIVSNDINNQYGATVTVLPVTSSAAKIILSKFGPKQTKVVCAMSPRLRLIRS
jgi:mRNA-degrading endonuclease toxin of MazEF toxin-antitoxin module